VNLAYPLLDLALLATAVAIIALTGWRPSWMGGVLTCGLALLAVADTAFIYASRVSAVDIGILGPLYALAMLLIGLAAWLEPAKSRAVDLGSLRLVALPSLFVLGAAGVLGYAALHHVNRIAIGLALAALCGTVIRTGLTFRALRSLAQTKLEASTDPLTGLANRRVLYRTLTQLLEDAPQTSCAVLFLDLNRFKELNDTLGHQVGDALLVEVSQRLSRALAAGELLVRLGGDEFAVLITDSSPADCTDVAERLSAALVAPLTFDGIMPTVEASIGVSRYPEHGSTVADLLRHADIAMYQAKHGRTGYEIYSPADDQHSRQRLALLSELHGAIARRELVLVYQPKASLASGAVTGVEALVRWQHPVRGLLEPDAFLHLAEQTGMIRKLTLYVLDQALADCAAWAGLGHPLPVAVNVSDLDLIDTTFPSQVARLLAERGIRPELLRLEVTESLILSKPTRTLGIIRELRRMGIEIALDDFGTGHSSLAHLKHLPIDELKIDRSFITQMTDDPRDTAIVESIVTLARNLGLRVVAEGVERDAEWKRLRDVRCTEAQGHLISRPVPAADLVAVLPKRLAA
jgi:diguanylate cyclase (GGDEF)-like protein